MGRRGFFARDFVPVSRNGARMIPMLANKKSGNLFIKLFPYAGIALKWSGLVRLGCFLLFPLSFPQLLSAGWRSPAPRGTHFSSAQVVVPVCFLALVTSNIYSLCHHFFLPRKRNGPKWWWAAGFFEQICELFLSFPSRTMLIDGTCRLRVRSTPSSEYEYLCLHHLLICFRPCMSNGSVRWAWAFFFEHAADY